MFRKIKKLKQKNAFGTNLRKPIKVVSVSDDKGFFKYLFIYFLILTATIASPRQSTMLARQDPSPQVESTLTWFPVVQVEPFAVEFHNSVQTLLSPFLSWVT